MPLEGAFASLDSTRLLLIDCYIKNTYTVYIYMYSYIYLPCKRSQEQKTLLFVETFLKVDLNLSLLIVNRVHSFRPITVSCHQF